jgi:hypothetical protein
LAAESSAHTSARAALLRKPTQRTFNAVRSNGACGRLAGESAKRSRGPTRRAEFFRQQSSGCPTSSCAEPATISITAASGGAGVPAKQKRTEARSIEDLNALMVRAQDGDKSVLPAIRQQLDSRPELWREAGDLATQIQTSLVQATAGENEIVKEAIHRRLDGLRNELLGEVPGALERLLVERILVCWLQVHHADAACGPSRGSLPLSHAEYLQRRLDRAQRRYLAAIRALAVVRRLQVPVVQVNIADRQVNVAKGAFGVAP